MCFRKRKIRKTAEKIAYYKGKVEVLERIMRADHSSLDRDELIKCTGNLRMYEQRLEGLKYEARGKIRREK